MLRSLEQERAKYAWECIQNVKSALNLELESKYKSYVKSSASYIQINGLGNTIAFYKSKFEADFNKYVNELKKKSLNESKVYEEAFKKLSNDKKAYKLLYDHLNGWFKKHFGKSKDIIKWIISENTSSIEVFQVTKEITALLNWMKRFAEAELKDKEGEIE